MTRLTNGVFTTRDLLYTSRAMKISLAGDYVLASGAMHLDVVIDHGRGRIKAAVTGTSQSPTIRVAPGSLLPAPAVERGLRDLLKRLR